MVCPTKKKGPRKRPLDYSQRSGLEDVLERDLETARIARLVRAYDLAKGRGGHAGLDVGVAAAGKERVIQRVQRLEAELDVPSPLRRVFLISDRSRLLVLGCRICGKRNGKVRTLFTNWFAETLSNGSVLK